MSGPDKNPIKIALESAQAELSKASDPFVTLFTKDDARVLLYAPKGEDTQTPHTQDEIYVIVSGAGMFRRGDDVVPFKPGDTLFVAAHVPHRFEDFTDDFATWVVFFGPRS